MTDEHIAATAQFYDQLSLYVTQATSHAAALSCGGVIECALAVARGQVRPVPFPLIHITKTRQ